jgi:hypothetical protein
MDTYKEPKRLVEEISTLGLLHVLSPFRLHEERDVKALRTTKHRTSNTTSSDFRAVTLASLHSLVKDWEPQHKAARPRLREDAPRMLKALAGKPAVHGDTLAALIGSLGEVATQTARCEVFAKFWVLAHAGQDCGEQSTTRSTFIADKLVKMTMDRYKEPKRLVEEIPAIGWPHVSNSFRLPEERDAPSLRTAKCKISNMNLSNSKADMLSLLRPLAKVRGTQHKVAWSCLWEAIVLTLKALAGKRAAQEKALAELIGSLGEVATQTARRDMYSKLLVLAHAGQDCLKQSTTRLRFIAGKLVQMKMDMYEEPKRLGEEISALALWQVSNSFRLLEERDGLSLRIAKYKISNMDWSSLKAVRLASLRSRLKDWGAQHKVLDEMKELTERTAKRIRSASRLEACHAGSCP